MPLDEVAPTRNLFHVQPSFYGVYLLQSIPKPNSFYVGSTPDPSRRLRQHNGELKNGGAFRTRATGTRPWRMIALVYNFHSKVAALQFEHSLQHPYQTRHIPPEKRISKNNQNNRTLAHKLGNIRLLLNADYFSRMGLKLLIFDDEVHKVWLQDKFGIEVPSRFEITISKFEDFFNIEKSQVNKRLKGKSTDMKRYFEESKKVVLLYLTRCSLCDKSIDYFPESLRFSNSTEHHNVLKKCVIPLLGVCYNCYCTSHITCLAKFFLKTDDSLIPLHGNCHKCNKILNWSEISEMATYLREVSLKSFLEIAPEPQGSHLHTSEHPNPLSSPY